MTQRTIDRLAWMLLAVSVLLSVLYFRLWLPVTMGDMDPDEFSRGIGTPLLLWLNGYLGVFLHLRYLGPVTMLGLPLCLLALWRWGHLPSWQRGLLAFTLLAIAVIGAFGGFNYRYAFTLQPLLTVAVVAVAWQVLSPRTRFPFVLALAAVTVLNSAMALEHRQRVWRAMPDLASPDTQKGTLRDRLDSGPRDLDSWLSVHGVAPTDTVLVNNLPIWYYVTQRPGIYYWCGSDQLFLADGKPFLFKDRSAEEVWHYLRNDLHCQYVFSIAEYDRYDPRFAAFLEQHTALLAQDDRGYTLHRLSDTFGR
jgi:hypothetical protein